MKYFRESKPQIDLDLECRRLSGENEEFVEVISRLSNRGRANLVVNKARIFIDEGWMGKNNDIHFPKLWVRERACPDCKLSVWCQQDVGNRYPSYVQREEIEGKYTNSVELEHFTRAIEYVTPGEKFCETKVISLSPDKFYRITLIVIPKHVRTLKIFERKVDCLCLYHVLPPIAF